MTKTEKDSISYRLLEHFNRFIETDSKDFQEIIHYFESRHLNKKEMVAEAGKLCNYNHFVLSGCLQMFFVDNKGIERTIQFAIENWWISDYLAFHKRTQSNYYIQAVEETQILSISYENQEILLSRFPYLEKYFRIIYEIAYGAFLKKREYLFEFTKEENYFHFTEHFPEFAQRVPQYLIASFLGLTPEYVSKIRSKKRS